MLVVTTESVPGYQVHAVLGEVHGVKARQRNAYADGVKRLDGVANPKRDVALRQCRDDAVSELRRSAFARGANAVLGMRFDNRDINTSWSEICAYGTAVVVIPANARRAALPPSPRARRAPRRA